MKGIAGITMAVGLIAFFILISLGVAFFSGGHQSAGLFGWGSDSILAGVETFITNIYNAIIIVGSWVTIFVLLVVFVAVQGLFIFFYYKIAEFFWQFKPLVDKFLEEISGI